jgi:chemotaxis regulatin CheY-phosphate phosphatase CheZ
MQQVTTAPVAASSSRTTTNHADSLMNATITMTGMDDLVHELRQPLSAIEHIAFYLQLVSEDPVICMHSQRIQDLIGQANEILARASA